MQLRPAVIAISALVLCVCATVPLGGCSKAGPVAGSSAKETAQNFADALNADDLKRAARAFDYLTAARRDSVSWDDIPKGQRDLIINKVRGDKEKELAAYKQRLGANIACGPVAEGSIVSLTGDGGSLSIRLREVDGSWQIYNVW